MSADSGGAIETIDVAFMPMASGPGIEVFAFEEHADAYLVASGYRSSRRSANRRECVALVIFTRTRQLIYGYPNEEAFFRDPRGALGHGVHEIRGSDWVERLDRENRASFGHALPYTDGLRHFFFGAKDASAQFLASGVEVEFFDAPTQSQQRAAARARVMELVLGPGFDG